MVIGFMWLFWGGINSYLQLHQKVISHIIKLKQFFSFLPQNKSRMTSINTQKKSLSKQTKMFHFIHIRSLRLVQCAAISKLPQYAAKKEKPPQYFIFF